MSKELHTSMSRPFYSDAKTAKNVSFSPSSFSSSHFLFPPDFSGTIEDTDIITTPPEPFRPTDVLFVRYKSESIDLGGVFGCKISRHLANQKE